MRRAMRTEGRATRSWRRRPQPRRWGPRTVRAMAWRRATGGEDRRAYHKGGSLRRGLRARLRAWCARASARLRSLLSEPAWLWQGQRGASVTEYALLLAVIAV